MFILFYDIKECPFSVLTFTATAISGCFTIHNTTSQASAASTDVEHNAITQSNNTEDIAFFISVTVMINERLRILDNVICRSYFLNVSFMLFK